MSVAVIDIGSNSVRLLLWEGEKREQRLCSTRLGEGAAYGFLHEDSVRHTVDAVAAFSALAAQKGLPVYAFATSAVRDAKNAAVLTEAIRKACAIGVDVLSGREEALCAYLGAVRGGDGGVIDIGGNSTELARGEKGILVQSASLQAGAVRQNTLFSADREKSEAYVLHQLAQTDFSADREQPFFGVGGTVTSLAAMRLGLSRYDPDRVDGCPLSLSFAQEATELLWDMPVSQRAQLPGISPSRAQIIHQGALMLLLSMRRLGLSQIQASVHDNLEGYAYLRRIV